MRTQDGLKFTKKPPGKDKGGSASVAWSQNTEFIWWRVFCEGYVLKPGFEGLHSAMVGISVNQDRL